MTNTPKSPLNRPSNKPNKTRRSSPKTSYLGGYDSCGSHESKTDRMSRKMTSDKLVQSSYMPGELNQVIKPMEFLAQVQFKSNIPFDEECSNWLEQFKIQMDDPPATVQLLENVRNAANKTVNAQNPTDKRFYKEYLKTQLPSKTSDQYYICRTIFLICILLSAAYYYPEEDVVPIEHFVEKFSEWTVDFRQDPFQMARLYRCYLHMQAAKIYIPVHTNKELIQDCAELTQFSGHKCTKGGKNPKFVKVIMQICNYWYQEQVFE